MRFLIRIFNKLKVRNKGVPVALFKMHLVLYFVLIAVLFVQHILSQKVQFDSHDILQSILPLIDPEYLAQLRGNLNELADKILEMFNELTAKEHMELGPLPEYVQKSKYALNWQEIHLKNGTIRGLSTIQRKGDVVVDEDEDANKLTARIPVTFHLLTTNFDYSAKFLGFEPTGRVTATISNLDLNVEMIVNLNKPEIELKDVQVGKSGRIKLKFRGHDALMDTFLSYASNTVIFLSKNIIMNDFVEKYVKTMLVEICNIINSVLY